MIHQTKNHKEAILLVDDDASSLVVLSNILATGGYSTYTAPDGEIALKFVHRLQPDLILLDIAMPEMDGFELCEQLKSNSRVSHIPVIFISALDAVMDKVQAFKVGAIDYITKPFHSEEVIARVSTHLSLQRMQREYQDNNKKLQQEILERRQNEARYRMLAENSSDMISRHAADGTYLYASPVCKTLLGYTPEELINTSSYEFFHPEDLAAIQQSHTTIVEQPIINTLCYRIRRKDGTFIWFETTSRTIRNPVTDSIEEIISVSRDITHRKQMEEELRESERRYRMLAENARDIIYRFRIHPTPGFEYVSPSITSVFGYTPEEYYANYQIHIQAIHPDSRNLFEEFLKSPHTYHAPLILRYIRKDGLEIWIEQRQWLIYDESSTLVAIEGITTDITARKKAEEHLLQQQQAIMMLHEQERLARELHDNMGQILGYINAQVQTIRAQLADNQIDRANSHLTDILSVIGETHTDIREFIFGVASAETKEYDFFTMIERYIERFDKIYHIKTHLIVSLDKTSLNLEPAIEVHLHRIIQEALTNIRKHAHASNVYITFSRSFQQVQVTIEDDGKGFQHSPQIEQKPDYANEHGYGLHSMRERTKEIGGNISIHSTPGNGTRIVVQFTPDKPAQSYPQRMRVMLVDDHPLFLDGMYNMLTNHGIPVVGIAHNGHEAIKKAHLLQPDVVLMDVEMPLCNGIEATRLIKAEYPNMQIVMLTVSAEDEYLFDAIKYGASGYLLKSLDAGDFFTLLSGLEQGEVALSPGLAKKILYEFRHKEQPIDNDLDEYTLVSDEDEGDEEQSLTHDIEKSDTLQQLTDLQIEILTMVAQGYTYRETGELLGYSESSIKNYMRQVIKKLHLRNRAEAVVYARNMGLS